MVLNSKLNFIVIVLVVFYLVFFFFYSLKAHFELSQFTEPVDKTYKSDELSFLKTFYLMEKGFNYYQAFYTSRLNMVEQDKLGQDLFTWRMPTIFYFWSLMANNGEQIFLLFTYLCLLFILFTFIFISRIFNGKTAAASIGFLIPYLNDTFRYKTAFLFTEWWGFFFFFFGLVLLEYKRKIRAVIFLSLAALTRELFFIPLFFLLVFNIFLKKDFKIFLSAVLISVFGYIVHFYFVSQMFSGEQNFSLLNRWHFYELDNLRTQISFSMRDYVYSGLKTHYLFVFFGLISLIANAVIFKKTVVIYILVTVASLLLILPMISIKENDYWGITYMPLILISIPLLLNLYPVINQYISKK